MDLSCGRRRGGEAESGIIGSSLDRNRRNSRQEQQQRPMFLSPDRSLHSLVPQVQQNRNNFSAFVHDIKD